jgi:hypothetical protein
LDILNLGKTREGGLLFLQVEKRLLALEKVVESHFLTTGVKIRG